MLHQSPVLFSALLGCVAGCYVPMDAQVPVAALIDRRHFDPVASYASVAARAGYEAQLVRIEARYVRDDGTVDSEAAYVNAWQPVVQYDFVKPIVPPNPRARYTMLLLSLLAPHVEWLPDWNGDAVRPTMVDGLYLRASGATDEAPAGATTPPRCSFGALWALAKGRGAPSNATATITYDAAGYDVSIDGTALRLAVDHDCREVPAPVAARG